MSKRKSKPQFSLNVSHDDLRRIIVEGDGQTLVANAHEIGAKLGKNLTTNQIRAIFGTVRQIEMNWSETAPANKQRQAQRDLVLLKPKMAYRASREGYRGRGLQALADTLSQAIDLVTDADGQTDARVRFGYFVDFFEAILAYHKVAGGR